MEAELLDEEQLLDKHKSLMNELNELENKVGRLDPDLNFSITALSSCVGQDFVLAKDS